MFLSRTCYYTIQMWAITGMFLNRFNQYNHLQNDGAKIRFLIISKMHIGSFYHTVANWCEILFWAPRCVRNISKHLLVYSETLVLISASIDSIWLDLIWFNMTCHSLISLTWPDPTWLDLTWLHLTSFDLAWPEVTRSDLTWTDLISFDLIRLIWFNWFNRPDLTWPDLSRCDVTWLGLTWHDSAWFYLNLFDPIWFDSINLIQLIWLDLI